MANDQTRFTASIAVPSRIESVRLAASFLVQAAAILELPPVENPLYEVAIVEALNNALKHNVRDGESTIRCEFEVAGGRLTISVLDEGALAPVVLAMAAGGHFSPSGVPADAWDALPESGYGLHLIQSVFPEMRPVSRDGCHGVELSLTF